MKAEMKTRIHFKPPVTNQINESSGLLMNYMPSNDSKANNPETKPQVVYNYTISIG